MQLQLKEGSIRRASSNASRQQSSDGLQSVIRVAPVSQHRPEVRQYIELTIEAFYLTDGSRPQRLLRKRRFPHALQGGFAARCWRLGDNKNDSPACDVTCNTLTEGTKRAVLSKARPHHSNRTTPPHAGACRSSRAPGFPCWRLRRCLTASSSPGPWGSEGPGRGARC